MRQATLPWAAPPPPLLPPTAQLIDTYHPHQQQHLPHASLDADLRDVQTPPHQQIASPPLPYALPFHLQHQQPDPSELQLDPALFSASREVDPHDPAVINVSTSELPVAESGEVAFDNMTSPCSSRASSSAASSSTGIPATTQQTELTSLETAAAAAAADPAVTAGPSAEPMAKAQSALHPFFRPGGPSTASVEANDDPDVEPQRPGRLSRAKVAVSYREDLKAVLRADAAQESARLKEEKRQARIQAAAAKKAQKQNRTKRDGASGDNGQDLDDFEVLETRVASSNPTSSNGAKAELSMSSASPSKAKQVPKQVESKPLSLAVKGTGAAATANPHPFFSKKPKQQPELPGELQSSRDVEVVDAAAPQTPSATAISSNSIPTATPAAWSLFSTQRSSSSKPRKPLNAVWPTAETTHVSGLTSNESRLLSQARSDLPAFYTRWRSDRSVPSISSAHQAPPPNFVARMNRTRPQSALQGISLTGSSGFGSTDDFVGQVEMMHLSQLLVADAKQQAESCQNSGQLWNDAFRPQRACGCLGNEGNADYLLDWLRRLLVAAPGSVRTTDGRKPGIQRRVDRKRKRRARRGYSDEEDSDGMADFIVDDDEDEDAPGEYDDSIAADECFGRFSKINRQQVLTDDERVDPHASQGTSAPAASTQTEQQPSKRHAAHYASLDKLSNCMILTGPNGSGKTASVYACASQLGYEVFELYPGMGRRSGRDLVAAVGDLGRNHMVSSGGVGGGATFKKASGSAASSSVVRQSLILIEEADVLFDEDKGFWTAVIELVAESKRPVVIVCNELELIPVHDLPVQQVLRYRKPRFDEATAWLQTVASEMGRFLTVDEVRELLIRLPGSVVADDVDEEAEADLRQAINQIQFGHFASEPHLSRTEARQRSLIEMQEAAVAEIKTVARAAESSSVADIFESGLGRGMEVEVFGEVGVEVSAEKRQWGSWVQLVPQPLAWCQQRQALSGSAEVEYRLTFADLHSKLGMHLPTILTGDGDYRGLNMTGQLLNGLQHREADRLHSLVRPLLVDRHTSSRLAPSMILDYAPMIRLMALVDEDLAQIHASLRLQDDQHPHPHSHSADAPAPQPALGGRSTRNSSRALTSWLSGTQDWGYQRWLAAVGPEEVVLAKQTAFSF